MDYEIQKDEDGFRLALRAALRRGECVIFRVGENVAVVERGFVSVKLRRQGSLAEYWTPIETISGN
jgi:predicted GNAT family acetyltransferase